MEIKKAPREMRINAIKRIIPWDEVKRLDGIAETAWMELYGRIEGNGGVAYWDGETVSSNGHSSFMRYAIHRSTKQDGFLQLSVMEIRDGEIIPTADTQHDSPESFLMEVPSYAVVNFA